MWRTRESKGQSGERVTSFELYDTKGKQRYVSSTLDVFGMRQKLSEFKTHCAIENKQYEYNHFVNWLKFHWGETVVYDTQERYRVDM
jgi:hypothetical protein